MKPISTLPKPARMRFIGLAGLFLSILFFGLLWPSRGYATVLAQQPTGSIPTVTSSPSGLMVTPKTGEGAEEQVNVRAGPGRNYAKVGMLTVGQYAPALGRTRGITDEPGDWILISYPGAPDGAGWVYAYVVDITGQGELPVAEPPAPPTPATTPTIDPTLAAQFIVQIPPTKLPTFTEPPPLVIPTYRASTASVPSSRVPMGFLVIGMGVVGLFGVFISVLRGR